MSNTNLTFMPFAPGGSVQFDDVAILLHPDDNIAIAKTTLQPETIVVVETRHVASILLHPNDNIAIAKTTLQPETIVVVETPRCVRVCASWSSSARTDLRALTCGY